MNSPALNERVKANAARLAGRRLSKDGVLMIEANRFRSQERNREDARERAEGADPARRPSRRRRARRPSPSRGAVERRLKEKSGRSSGQEACAAGPDKDERLAASFGLTPAPDLVPLAGQWVRLDLAAGPG